MRSKLVSDGLATSGRVRPHDRFDDFGLSPGERTHRPPDADPQACGLSYAHGGGLTPTEDGVSRIKPFCEGIGRYAQANGIALSCRSLSVPPTGLPRPTSMEAADFIREALTGDYPVAFLNLDSGQVGTLEDWHWVTIVEMEESAEEPRIRLRVYDGDREETVDYGLWHRTTVEGGALVYLLPDG